MVSDDRGNTFYRLVPVSTVNHDEGIYSVYAIWTGFGDGDGDGDGCDMTAWFTFLGPGRKRGHLMKDAP